MLYGRIYGLVSEANFIMADHAPFGAAIRFRVLRLSRGLARA